MQLETVSTVLAAADSYDLVSLIDLKTDLGITDDSQDAYLARAISQASLEAANYCHRVFAVETVQDVIDFSRHRFERHMAEVESLEASRFPLISVASVTEGTMLLTADVDYTVDLNTGLLHRAAAGITTTWRIFPVTIEFVAGFAAVPSDLQGKVSKIVGAMRQSITRDPYLRSQNVPGVLESSWWIPTGADAGHFTPDVAEVLDHYKVPVVR